MAIDRGTFFRNTLPSPAGYLAVDNDEAYPDGCTSQAEPSSEMSAAMVNNDIPLLDEPNLILLAPDVTYGLPGEGNADADIESPVIVAE